MIYLLQLKGPFLDPHPLFQILRSARLTPYSPKFKSLEASLTLCHLIPAFENHHLLLFIVGKGLSNATPAGCIIPTKLQECTLQVIEEL